MKSLDLKILDLMKTDPQKAISLALEQYTPLVWRVASRRLSNPEDVRECVNDVFTEFYLKWEQFDPRKGELSSYLAKIAQNLAITRYRKNQSGISGAPIEALSEDLADPSDLFSDTDLKLDVEQVLQSLSAEDASMIRMKYYDGKTFSQIAQELNLPYETVKKRHQRSLKKLRRTLISLLVLALAALLTACALRILYHYGIIPGYGVSQDTSSPAYFLEEKVSAENEEVKIEISNAFWLNGILYLEATATTKTMTADEYYNQVLFSSKVYPDYYYNGTELSQCLINSSHTPLNQNVATNFQKYSDFSPDTLNDHHPEITMEWYGLELTFALVPSHQEQVEHYPYQMQENGGIMAIPRLENDHLIVSLYPLSTDDKEICAALVRDYAGQSAFGDITVTASDGTEYAGSCIGYHPYFNELYFDWDFGELPAGDYTLHIPFLYLMVSDIESESMTLNLETLTCEDPMLSTKYGTLTLLDCTRFYPESGEDFFGKVNADLDTTHTAYFSITLQYTPSSDDQTLTFCPVEGSCPQIKEPPTFENTMHDAPAGICMGKWNPEEQTVTFGFVVYTDCYDLSEFTFQLASYSRCSVRWNQDFHIPFSVK